MPVVINGITLPPTTRMNLFKNVNVTLQVLFKYNLIFYFFLYLIYMLYCKYYNIYINIYLLFNVEQPLEFLDLVNINNTAGFFLI